MSTTDATSMPVPPPSSAAVDQPPKVNGNPFNTTTNKPLSKTARKRLRAERHNAKWSAVSPEDRAKRREQYKSTHAETHEANTLNQTFVTYYKAQNIMPESEWPTFVESLQRTLPTTFRIGTINAVHTQLLNRLRKDGFGTRNADGTSVHMTSVDGAVVHAPTPIPWYPDSLAWYVDAGKSQLRRIDALKPFREFLIGETTSGNVTRQEAVSMIPPLLLDVQPHHCVLDMCAAPGSKTGQLLEMLHSNATKQSSVPTGFVIANDADAMRAYMLVHQLKRLGSPNFLVTTHQGQRFPTLYRHKQMSNGTATNGAHTTVSDLLNSATATTPANTQGIEPILFDRILCDVPCSGDGTLRKAPTMWRRWNTSAGNGLHALQLMIARRSIQLLKPGGLMVYSTCSLNPIENEAAVAELIRRSNNTVELVDTRAMLPQLIREPGLLTWTVFDKHTPVTFSPVEHTRSSRVKPSFFPPTQQEAEVMHLDWCMRILPHKQDTGGFFVAVLRKVDTEQSRADTAATMTKPLSAADVKNGSAVDDIPIQTGDDAEDLQQADLVPVGELAADDADADGDNGNGSAPPQRQHKSDNKVNRFEYREDPFCEIKEDVSKQIIDFFGLPPTINTSNFWTRHEGNKRLFFVAPSISDILVCERNHRLKVVNAGSRCLEYNRAKSSGERPYRCCYRIAQEGVDYLLPYCSKQVLRCDYAAFKVLLQIDSLLILPYANDEKSQLGADIRMAEPGCVVCVLRGPEAERLTTRDSGLAVTAWMTGKSIQLMITKDRKVSIASLLASDTSSAIAANATSI